MWCFPYFQSQDFKSVLKKNLLDMALERTRIFAMLSWHNPKGKMPGQISLVARIKVLCVLSRCRKWQPKPKCKHTNNKSFISEAWEHSSPEQMPTISFHCQPCPLFPQTIWVTPLNHNIAESMTIYTSNTPSVCQLSAIERLFVMPSVNGAHTSPLPNPSLLSLF